MILKLFVESQILFFQYLFSNLIPQNIKCFISLLPGEYNRPLSPTLYVHHTATLLDDFIKKKLKKK